MAAGDVANFFNAAVTNGTYLDLQPSAGVEVVIHNFCYEGAMELYYRDGGVADEFLVDADSTLGSRMGVFLHCTNGRFYRIKNVSGGTVGIGADGMTTK